MAHAQEQPPETARLHHRMCDECGRVTIQWMTRERAIQEPDGTITPGASTWHCSALSPAGFRQGLLGVTPSASADTSGRT